MNQTRMTRWSSAGWALSVTLMATPVWATSLPGDGSPVGGTPSPKTESVKKFLDECRTKGMKDAACEKLRKESIDILKDDLQTLGSSANPGYVPVIQTIFKSDEPELRIAAADAIGMIGAQSADFDVVAAAANDAVPDVRRAVQQMLSSARSGSFAALARRIGLAQREGHAPEAPADPGKFGFPAYPSSVYLFYSSNTDVGRLTFTAGKNLEDVTAFFKGKAKKSPMKAEEFRHSYQYQLDDERRAQDAAFDQTSKQVGNLKPDPANMAAYTETLAKLQTVNSGRSLLLILDLDQPDLFGSPTVFVLEERQIGGRTYPTKYAVVYQDLALKQPGYRLAWMTAGDEAIKLAQASTLDAEKQEAARKKEYEADRKRREEQQAVEKKKDEAERKKFKKGQDDLEKALGF